jgi:DNA polymerase-3 subunit alpha
LLCVQTAGSMNDPKRFKFDSDQFFVKSAAQMEKLFSHAPQVVSRTMQFASAVR